MLERGVTMEQSKTTQKSPDWIPCAERMPTGEKIEIPCLVTCQKWDLFKDEWGKPQFEILSYLPTIGIWNIKTPVKVLAWIPLPEIYEEELK